MAREWDKWVIRMGLHQRDPEGGKGVPLLGHKMQASRVKGYIKKYLDFEVLTQTIKKTTRKINARMADMWWGFAEATHFVQLNEHDEAHGRGELPDKCVAYYNEFSANNR